MFINVLPIDFLRNGHLDDSLFQEMDFISDVSKFNDKALVVVPVWFEEVDNFLDDLVFEVSEVRDGLDHAPSELKVSVSVVPDTFLDVHVDLGELVSDLIEVLLFHVSDGGGVAGSDCAGSFEVGDEGDFPKVLSFLQNA